MPFSLLAPLFALGIAAVAIPLLVHLVHKERKDAMAFPSLMFVRRTPYPFSARQRIRDVLLFLLRCALIVLAAVAFARPVLARRQAAGMHRMPVHPAADPSAARPSVAPCHHRRAEYPGDISRTSRASRGDYR